MSVSSAATTSKIVAVGVGGPTCSGKTTLAKHLVQILKPSSKDDTSREDVAVERPCAIKDAFILHQDDFAPPEATLPVNEKFGVTDWDHPPTAIDYKRMYRTIEHIKSKGTFPPDFSSHDHLNSQPDCPIAEEVYRSWKDKFGSLSSSGSLPVGGIRIMLADGFLLYYNQEVSSTMDIKILLRTPRAMLKQRRESRFGYATAEGTVWKDPEGYFDNIVWPAYELAHRNVFSEQDVEKGEPVRPKAGDKPMPGGPIEGVRLLEALPTESSDEQEQDGSETSFSKEMTQMVDKACAAIWEHLTTQL